MSDVKERLVSAQWVFDRSLGWIAAAEIKVAAICAVDTAMIAGLGALFISQTPQSMWAQLFGLFSFLSLFAGIFCAALVLIPRLDGGPSKSLLYFGKIVGLEQSEYQKQFTQASDELLLDDWTAQIHFNARIALKKHEWTRRCLYCSLIGALPWVGAVLATLVPSCA